MLILFWRCAHTRNSVQSRDLYYLLGFHSHDRTPPYCCNLDTERRQQAVPQTAARLAVGRPQI